MLRRIYKDKDKTSNAVKDTLVKSVSITGEITLINPGVPYNKEVLALKTGKEIYVLTGKTTSMNKYIGYYAKITGTISKGPQGIMMFNIKTYKIIAKSSPMPILTPTPTLIPGPTTVPVPSEPPVREVTLQGYLSNLNSDKFKFYLETQNGLYELIGNTKDM